MLSSKLIKVSALQGYIFFQGLWITERLNCFHILSLYFCFFTEEVVLLFCHCVCGHTFHLPENVNLNKIKLKILINFKLKLNLFYFIVYKLYFLHLCKNVRSVQGRFIKA